MTSTPLIAAETLLATLDDPALVIVDCRFSLANPDAGESAYRVSHLPGARYAHLDRDLSGRHVPGAGRHPWPEAADFAARLGAWGIGPDSRVVAYDDGDGAFAARLWWLLRVLGHRRVAVLDGGWGRWVAAGHRLDTAVPVLASVGYPGTFAQHLLADAVQVQAHLAGGGLLLDARAPERFRGQIESIDPVAGHVPGACNRAYVANLADGVFKSAQVLRQEFEALLDHRPPTEMIAMCGSGVTGCHHLLAMAHAGLPGARLYAGSWSGWIEDPAHPVATGDT